MVQVDSLTTIIQEIGRQSYGQDAIRLVISPIRDRIKLIIKSVWPESPYLSKVDAIEFNDPNSIDFYAQHQTFQKAKFELIALIKVVIDDMKMNAVSTVKEGSDTEPNRFDFDKVFIVHGHDDLAKTETARFIEKLGFTPIILHEQASSGKTIIEKIEAHSNVGFGVVLYTSCDIGAVRTDATNLQARARQNVVFEHGYLIGKLGRDKVCALVKDNVETPSDIDGIVFVQMDSGQAWRFELAKELKAAGYPVDMNKI